MSKINSTATTPEEFAEQFPDTIRPFAVWYNSDPGCNHKKWAVNDETGVATSEFADMATALKTAAEMGKEWADEARIQAQALAKVIGADKPGFLQHIEEYCIMMDAYFDLAMGEINKHNNTDFDGLRFLTEAAKSKMLEFSHRAYDVKEEVEAAHA